MRRSSPVLAILLLAAACATAGTGTDPDAVADPAACALPLDEDRADPVALDRAVPGPVEQVRSALDGPIDHDELPPPLVDPDQLLSGGPAPDGIPPIDEPTFLRVGDVGGVAGCEPVLVLEVGDDVHVYPVQVMTWHEIVNDVVGGVPVTVAYCPLCNSAVAYDRRVGDRLLDFGTSGRLLHSSLVMYDRQTESLWSHLTGEAVAGVLTGTELDPLAVATVSWADAAAAHPDAWVLSRRTGHDRDYGTNPYVGYEGGDGPYAAFVTEPIDPRLHPMARVVGLGEDDDAVAVPEDVLVAGGAVEVDVAGSPVVVLFRPGTASALDARAIAAGVDVGATGAFVPEAPDGTRLHLGAVGDGFVDEETSSTWDLLGRAVAGPLRGARLTPVTHLDTFWFAWSAFHPATSVAAPDGR